MNLLSGILLCPCGNGLNAGNVRSRRTVKGRQYAYTYSVYRCRRASIPGNTSGHSTVIIPDADEWVTTEVLRAIAEGRVSVSGGGNEPEKLAAIYEALADKFREIEHVQGLLVRQGREDRPPPERREAVVRPLGRPRQAQSQSAHVIRGHE